MRVAAPLDLNLELRKIPLFAELPRHHFADVLARAHPTRVDRDRPLVTEGEATTAVPVLLQGLVKVSLGRVLVDVLRGPTLPVASLTVDATACPVTMVAMRPCDLALVDRGMLLAAIHANPNASQKLAELLARESRSYLKRVPELVGGSVEERLMSLLDRLAERHGSPLDDGRYLPLPLRRCDLAMMVHATTETVSRTLAEWERRGWLRSNRSGLWWGSRRLRDSVVPPPARVKSERPIP
ncbi:MAG: Crp/Fnr family transcriptional regulator [Polyangiales bacterium]